MVSLNFFLNAASHESINEVQSVERAELGWLCAAGLVLTHELRNTIHENGLCLLPEELVRVRLADFLARNAKEVHDSLQNAGHLEHVVFGNVSEAIFPFVTLAEQFTLEVETLST